MVTKKPKGKKKSSQKKTNPGGGGIIFHGSAKIGGDVIARDQIITNSYNTTIQVRDQLFDQILTQIDKRQNTSPDVKADLKAEVEEIKAEAAKGEQANESFVERRLRNIMRMAPDILEVVTATLVNPAVGLAKVVEKISKKAAEAGSSG